jgi:putative sigma-54 modulation protein
MQIAVMFKNTEPSEHLKGYVSEKLNRLDKYLYNPAEANVVLLVEKHRHIAEVNITGDRLNIVGKEETGDMYSAIDMVVDKIEKQIKKSKEKTRERRTGGGKGRGREAVAETGSPSLPGESRDMANLHVTHIDYKPMHVEDAMMQLELLTDNFLVFTNARSDQVNVLYRRKDGGFGLIQPSP